MDSFGAGANQPVKCCKWKIKLVAGLGLFTALVAWWIGGSILIAPHRTPRVVLPPDLGGERIQIHSKSGAELAGNYLPGTKPATIILMHGVRGNRAQMIDRARFLRKAGYSILMFDFQAHGESTGDHITYGCEESRDVISAVQYARQRRPGDKIVLLGSSLGGAAAILAQSEVKADALILEMTFSTIEKAASNRLEVRLGRLGRWLTPLLTCQIPLRLHIPIATLHPIDRLGAIGVPKLIIAGAEDRLTTIEESRAMFAAAAEPKELWVVEGAGHIDLYAHAPRGYEEKVGLFLTRVLEDSRKPEKIL